MERITVASRPLSRICFMGGPIKQHAPRQDAAGGERNFHARREGRDREQTEDGIAPPWSFPILLPSSAPRLRVSG